MSSTESRIVESAIRHAAAANGAAADAVLAPLDELLALEGEYDERFLRPSLYAESLARELIGGAVSADPRLADLRPVFSTLGDGSVYARWRRGSREAHLLVPPDERVPARLYFVDGAQDGVDSPAKVSGLAR